MSEGAVVLLQFLFLVACVGYLLWDLWPEFLPRGSASEASPTREHTACLREIDRLERQLKIGKYEQEDDWRIGLYDNLPLQPEQVEQTDQTWRVHALPTPAMAVLVDGNQRLDIVHVPHCVTAINNHQIDSP